MIVLQMNMDRVTILLSRAGDPNFLDQPLSTISSVSHTCTFIT